MSSAPRGVRRIAARPTTTEVSRIQGRPKGRRLAVGVLALAVAALAVAVYLNVRVAQGEDGGARPTAILVVQGDHCYLVPTSCSGLAPPVTTVWLSNDASIAIAQDVTLQAVDAAEPRTPLAALVLVPTPPPRAA